MVQGFIHTGSLFLEARVCLEITRLSKETEGVISHIFYTWSKLDCSLLFSYKCPANYENRELNIPYGLNEIHTSGIFLLFLISIFFFSIFKFFSLRTPHSALHVFGTAVITFVCLFSISINLLAFYHECRSLIIYWLRYSLSILYYTINQVILAF